MPIGADALFLVSRIDMTSSFTASPLDNLAANIGITPTADTPVIDAPVEKPAGPTFESLGLCADIVSALTAAGYQNPTPVQQRAIPAALAGRDLLVSSPTGSGKTAAFMLPAIEKFSQLQKQEAQQPREPRDPNARSRRPQPVARPRLLVLTPTRELAMQVSTAATTYGKHLRRLRTVSILGGVAYGQQLMLLAKNPEILVATPGRLIDHLERGRIDLSSLNMLVLDEADRMLDMGFIEDIERIVDATPASRQTLLFSATIDNKITSLTGRLLKDPERIEIVQKLEANGNIAQEERRRSHRHSSRRRGLRVRRAARRPAARRAQSHDSRTARAPCARAGRNRRRRARHRHSGHHARLQLRPAEVRGRLCAPNRPYRSCRP
jgi:superfamily II DNA/RNA helicase